MGIENILDQFPSKYLRVADIGRGKRVIMDQVRMETVGGRGRKPVLSFQDPDLKQRPLHLLSELRAQSIHGNAATMLVYIGCNGPVYERPGQAEALNKGVSACPLQPLHINV